MSETTTRGSSGLERPGPATVVAPEPRRLPAELTAVRDGDVGMPPGALTEAAYEEAELRLAPGGTVPRDTDGPVERRDTLVDDAAAPPRAVVRQPSGSFERRRDQPLTRGGSDTDDDLCVVGVQVL
ncbi:hypothetical protein [Streptomyces sp. NPDC085529]|uniref:hypothetical protein n=1 Tax=Streptomyces sp. NPDC085529 TaxID=3365729 RepID=UPI0037CCCE38